MRLSQLTVPVVLFALTGCAAVNTAQQRRDQQWMRSSITLGEARDVLGQMPYAVPGLEIVAIHLDHPTGVVMVEQRVKPGILISLSQYRGEDNPLRQRLFWAYERFNPERVEYTANASTSRYVMPSNTSGLPAFYAARWFTRVERDLTIRIWGGWLTPEQLSTLLQEATPAAETR